MSRPEAQETKKSGFLKAFFEKLDRRTMTLDSKTLNQIEADLKKMLQRLGASLKEHDRETSELLPQDSADAAAQLDELEVTEAQEKRETKEIEAIRAALRRILAGTYGNCAGCGRPIPAERLAALPHAEHCLACQKRAE